jgi:D-glycero-D-manno-heptose 1,7-bisphosphate phosphatase
MNKAIFFDRDGVITPMIYEPEEGIVETVRRPQDVSLVYGIDTVMKAAHEKGYKLIVVSNQPNIGLGKMTKELFDKVCKEMNRQLDEKGITLDDEYYAFFHPHAKLQEYKEIPDTRKPKPDMILDAAKKHAIDLKESWMIGDGVNDIKAGSSAGCKTALLGNIVESEYLHVLEANLNGVVPTVMLKKLPEFIEYL